MHFCSNNIFSVKYLLFYDFFFLLIFPKTIFFYKQNLIIINIWWSDCLFCNIFYFYLTLQTEMFESVREAARFFFSLTLVRCQWVCVCSCLWREAFEFTRQITLASFSVLIETHQLSLNKKKNAYTRRTAGRMAEHLCNRCFLSLLLSPSFSLFSHSALFLTSLCSWTEFWFYSKLKKLLLLLETVGKKNRSCCV